MIIMLLVVLLLSLSLLLLSLLLLLLLLLLFERSTAGEAGPRPGQARLGSCSARRTVLAAAALRNRSEPCRVLRSPFGAAESRDSDESDSGENTCSDHRAPGRDCSAGHGAATGSRRSLPPGDGPDTPRAPSHPEEPLGSCGGPRLRRGPGSFAPPEGGSAASNCSVCGPGRVTRPVCSEPLSTGAAPPVNAAESSGSGPSPGPSRNPEPDRGSGRGFRPVLTATAGCIPAGPVRIIYSLLITPHVNSELSARTRISVARAKRWANPVFPTGRESRKRQQRAAAAEGR